MRWLGPHHSAGEAEKTDVNCFVLSRKWDEPAGIVPEFPNLNKPALFPQFALFVTDEARRTDEPFRRSGSSRSAIIVRYGR